jgi:hypothetical protein
MVCADLAIKLAKPVQVLLQPIVLPAILMRSSFQQITRVHVHLINTLSALEMVLMEELAAFVILIAILVLDQANTVPHVLGLKL